LVDHCSFASKEMGAKSLHAVRNPHAEAFYRSCGFVKLGVTATRFGEGLLMKRHVQRSPSYLQ
jgi:hypothetical protein